MNRFLFLLASTVIVVTIPLQTQTLRVATINVWSGLDYSVGWHMGEWQSDSIRTARLELLASDLARNRVDVVALQEANPAGGFASCLATRLGFDEIHQYVNAGVRLLGIGYPSNLNEGIAILARRSLGLQKKESVKIDGPFGFHGGFFSFHTSEANFALIGKIVVDSVPVHIAAVHLRASLPASMADTIAAVWSRCGIAPEDTGSIIRRIRQEAAERHSTFRDMLAEVSDRYAQQPMIILGDFNAEPSSPEILTMLEYGYADAAASAADAPAFDTWAPSVNTNIRYSTLATLADGSPKTAFDRIASLYDMRAHRIDYIFLNPCLAHSPVARLRPVGIEPALLADSSALHGSRLYASDHFGVCVDVSLSKFAFPVACEYGTVTPPAKNFDVFAFPSYDSDTGIGAGVKVFLLNFANWNESFDVTAYASALNERWLRFGFSVPDVETRQGKVYPLALDLTADYDKYLRANFFPGYANGSDEGMETYMREPLELSAAVSRGFTGRFWASAIVRYKHVRNANFNEGSAIYATAVPANYGTSSFVSGALRLSYDSRDSYVNPRDGLVLQCELEKGVFRYVDAGTQRSEDAARFGAVVQWYTELFYPTTIAAVRASVYSLTHEGHSPLWMKYSLGGTNTLRGYAMDRFLGDAMGLANCEVRFPIYRRLGGVLFGDAGTVSGSVRTLSTQALHSSEGIGLRLLFDTFVVRCDAGFSGEGMGLYVNFSHLF